MSPLFFSSLPLSVCTSSCVSLSSVSPWWRKRSCSLSQHSSQCLTTGFGPSLLFPLSNWGSIVQGSIPRAGNTQACVMMACTPTAATDNDIISSFPGWTRPALEGRVVHVWLCLALTLKGCCIWGFSTQLFQDFLFEPSSWVFLVKLLFRTFKSRPQTALVLKCNIWEIFLDTMHLIDWQRKLPSYSDILSHAFTTRLLLLDSVLGGRPADVRWHIWTGWRENTSAISDVIYDW